MFHLSSLKCTEMDPSSNDDVPQPKRKMPNKKRKFGTRIKGGDTKPSTSNANASTVPVASEQSTTAASAPQQQEVVNPYTKMRVSECRATLVDRDTRISQLLKELEASKEETKPKDIIIAQRKEAMHVMSQDLQVSRRECNDMLAEQRDANSQVLKLTDKKVAASKRNTEAIVAKQRDANSQVLHFADKKVADAEAIVADALSDM